MKMTRRTVLAACLATLFGFCRRGGVPSEDELRTQTDQIRSLIVTSEDLAEQHVQLQNSGPGNYLTLTVEVLGEFADRASAVGRIDDLMRDIVNSEDIFLEPSTCASFWGPIQLMKDKDTKAYIEQMELSQKMSNAIHVPWATGGSLVPQEIREEYMHTHLK